MVTAASAAANKGDAAKEASDFIHRGLEHALYDKVKEYESADSIRSCKKKGKAVDFFLRRRERCDKFVRESVAPDREELERLAAEEEKRHAEEAQAACKGAAKIKVESIEVKPLEGQIKLPAMPVNVMNNSSVAKPFGSEAGSSWAPVSFTSQHLSTAGDSMMSSSFFQNNGAGDSAFYNTPSSCNGAHFNLSTAKSYKPVAFMNFKPRNPTWREDSQHKNLQNSDVNDILGMVHAREAAQAKEADDARARAESSARAKLPNGVGPLRLSKVSLNDNVGKWRPSNDNWRPGVNTDGFFKALGIQRDIEENKEAYKNNSLGQALEKANYGNASKERQTAMVNGRQGEVQAAGQAKSVQAHMQKFA